MVSTVTETFFLADEVGRDNFCMPADMFNLARTLLGRSEFGCVFVPIRQMQFMGVITENEINFVDSQAYAYNQNEGGRLIMLAWHFRNAGERQSLNEPVQCDVLYYHPDSSRLQLQLIGEFRRSLQQLDQRYRDKALPPDGAKILRL